MPHLTPVCDSFGNEAQDGVRDGVTPGSVALPAWGAPMKGSLGGGFSDQGLEGWPAAPSGGGKGWSLLPVW